jgi:hypothetical protein
MRTDRAVSRNGGHDVGDEIGAMREQVAPRPFDLIRRQVDLRGDRGPAA